MLRFLFMLILSTFSLLAFAQEGSPPMLFEPSKEDVSLYYLGAIFGSELFPYGTDLHIFSYVFEIFNQVALVTGLLIVIGTLIVGVLKTAGEGKVLGEKWSATWLPIRIVVGMCLLIPKAGSGYSLGQVLVAWLLVQGIGAADTIWSKTLDYFIEGGAIYSHNVGGSTSYMNTTNLQAAYDLEKWVLRNATCLVAHNNSEAAQVMGKFKIYQTDDYKYVNYGNEDAWDPTVGGSAGRECGWIEMPKIADGVPNADLALQTYNNAFYDMARASERSPAKMLAGEDGANPDEWESEFTTVQNISVSYVEYLKGANDILYPQEEFSGSDKEYRDNLEKLKDYGWALAGNYYMTLTSFTDELPGIVIDIPNTVIEDPTDELMKEHADAIKNSLDFWSVGEEDPRHLLTFDMWENKFVIAAYPYLESGPPDNNPKDYRLTKERVGEIKNLVRQLGRAEGGGTMSPIYYMEEITGFGKDRQDPILRATKFGHMLTETAVIMVLVAGVLFMALMTGVGLWGGIACTGVPALWFWGATFVAFTAPIIFGIAAFMYAQGVMLGVALPLIPFVFYLVAVLGFFLAAIEMIVVAPLIAIGLVFPEANQDIWGKAEPAYMMLLNLMLRPSLIVIGFVGAMVLTWVAVELFNAAFYLFIADAVRIENILFGYIVITTTYCGLLLAIVAKIFGFVSDLPNKALQVLGDRTQAQPGADEIFSQAKQGVERGGSAVGGAMSAGGGAVADSGRQVAGAAQKGKEKDEEEKKFQARNPPTTPTPPPP